MNDSELRARLLADLGITENGDRWTTPELLQWHQRRILNKRGLDLVDDEGNSTIGGGTGTGEPGTGNLTGDQSTIDSLTTSTGTGQPLLSDANPLLLRFGTAPLDIVETFGAVRDSDCTQAITDALAEQADRGHGIVTAPGGRFLFSGEHNIQNGLQGIGVGDDSDNGTVFEALDDTATFRVGVVDTVGDYAVGSIDLGGGRTGDFTIDGAGILGGPSLLRVGLVGGRLFDNIRVDNHGGSPGVPAMIIWGAQNCVFDKLTVVNGQYGGCTLDYGAGGNTFNTMNTSRCSQSEQGAALLVTESQSKAGLGVYSTSGPSANVWYNGIFERVQNSPDGLVRMLCGLNNVFHHANFAAGSEITVPCDLLYVGADITGGSTVLRLNECQWSGGQTLATGLHLDTGIGTTALDGLSTFRTILNAIVVEGSAGFHMQGANFVSVTNQFTVNAGKGPVLSPAYHLSSGQQFRMEQWEELSEAAGWLDGRFYVSGPGGAIPNGFHYIYTYPDDAAPPLTSIIYRATADQTNATDSLVDDADLQFPVVNGGTYYFEGDAAFTGDTTGKLELKMVGPAGSGSWTPDAVTSAATSATAQINRKRYAFGTAAACGASSEETVAKPSGTFTATANGTVKLQFRRNNVSATSVVRKSGSQLKVTRIS